METKRPTDTLCPTCGTIFQQPARTQGGGRHTIYCSRNCLSKDWARKNGEKRKATILKYEAVPENKERKRIRAKERRAEKYGWSSSAFRAQLRRQNNVCYGCLRGICEKTAQIDHDHVTGKVRGLLCQRCNVRMDVLVDQRILRRLMSYLTYDKEKTMLYLGGALKNPRVPELGGKLRALGIDVVDDWYGAGEFADTSWREYEKQRGRTFVEALRGRAGMNTFLFDSTHIDLCDIFVLVMPAGKSGMLELGYAKGSGKTTCLFMDGDEPERYDIMPGLVDVVLKTEDQLISWLKTRQEEDSDDVKASNAPYVRKRKNKTNFVKTEPEVRSLVSDGGRPRSY